ncbi:MAG: hypothetical protein J5J06_10255 [Phycisphaerae bacterium]|nr:hypothetical protein [Phycisphaerae bacterium]
MSTNPECSKRLWVLTALSDDDVLDAGAPLPRGLSLHLAQCSSCRELAEDLQSVGRGLREMGRSQMPAGLQERAVAQARTALMDGARPTGRVDLDALEDDPAPDSVPSAPIAWPHWAACAAAAMVLLTVGSVAWWAASGPGPKDEGVYRSARSTVDSSVARPSRTESAAPDEAPSLADLEESGMAHVESVAPARDANQATVAQQRPRPGGVDPAEALERLLDTQTECVPRAMYLSRPMCEPPPK